MTAPRFSTPVTRQGLQLGVERIHLSFGAVAAPDQSSCLAHQAFKVNGQVGECLLVNRRAGFSQGEDRTGVFEGVSFAAEQVGYGLILCLYTDASD